MRYYLRARAWHLTENFIIRDDAGNPIFEIRGKIFHIGDNLVIYDCFSQQEVVHIKQRVFSLLPYYKIYRNGQQWASVHQQWLRRFKVKGSNGMAFHIDGDAWSWGFNLNDGQGHHLGRVNFKLPASSHPFSSRGYAIDVAPGADAPFVIALAIVLEMIKEHRTTRGVGV